MTIVYGVHLVQYVTCMYLRWGIDVKAELPRLVDALPLTAGTHAHTDSWT